MDDEQELLRKLRQGDNGALETVIKLHHAFLVAMAMPLVGPESADDVAQETWLRAFAAIGKFEGRSKLRTWLRADRHQRGPCAAAQERPGGVSR